jgi:hypothetical protein
MGKFHSPITSTIQMRVNSVLADVHIRLVLAGRTLEISALKLRMKLLATITTTTASPIQASPAVAAQLWCGFFNSVNFRMSHRLG